MSKPTKAQITERAEALERIREVVKPGDTVFCILRSVSKSGMSRVIQFEVMINNEPRFLGYNMALALDLPYDRQREGVKVGGCGMDMGFATVYTLGRTLFPSGGGIEGVMSSTVSTDGPIAPAGHKLTPTSPEHAAQMIAQGYVFPFTSGERSGWQSDGGYLLNYRWL